MIVVNYSEGLNSKPNPTNPNPNLQNSGPEPTGQQYSATDWVAEG